MSDQAIRIIGAGPAGLAVAAELAHSGVRSVVLERADAVGACWRGRYDRLRLNTCRCAYALGVGPGGSGLEIAFDLVKGGAGRVRVAVRTQPNIMLRQSGGLPGDVPALALLSLPPRIADVPARLVRRLSVGDLSDYGLVPPAEGLFARYHRERKTPAIVDKEVLQAIRDGRIAIVAGLESFEQTGVTLVDGTRIKPEGVIAATAYSRGLEPLVGHLGVLDERGV